MIHFLNILCCVGISLFFGNLAWASRQEKELRAAKISLAALVGNLIFWHMVDHFAPLGLNLGILSTLGLFSLISLVRFFPSPIRTREMAHARPYDERDNMFARNNLKNHPQNMAAYYQRHPEFESTDKQIHKKPDFGSPEQTYYDNYATPVYEAAFEFLETTIHASNGAVAAEKKEINPDRMVQALKDLVHYYGGCDLGIARLKPYHFYTHKGRHARDWGKETDQDYTTALVIVVAMGVDAMKKAPTGAIIQESAQKYVEGAKISNIMAGYIRKFGYRARAHNDANYETLCVPLAVDSGLGELGRMGIFMHPVHGPCVRLAVVTTELELPETRSLQNWHMENFCRICKKCADNCPSNSITQGDEPTSRGFRHWNIDQEKCFSYWKTIGSDCGMCISVCPYTKPDPPIHKLVRLYISRNFINQKIALFMDDFLYGRSREIPSQNPERIF